MARPRRIHLPGGFYHVTLRGNHRQAIFFEDKDRAILDAIVADSVVRLAARVHAYCWMTNHIHMLIQISDVPLGRVMLRIAGKYARVIQAAMRTTGHLFEKRHHAVLIDSEAYLLTLVRYIHLNPVRAALVGKPGDYRWSSHHEYLGTRAQPWVTTSAALLMLGAQPDSARQRYCELIGMADDLSWGAGVLQPNPDNSQVLGDDAFLARISMAMRAPGTPETLDELIEECCRNFHVTPDAITSASRNRRLSAARAWLAQEAIARRVATVVTIARRLGRTDTAIRRLLERHRMKPA